jgi:P-type Mg2+ transporter
VLGLVAVTAVLSFFLGYSKEAIIIGVILAVSIGLGIVNEYCAECASAALHSGVHHAAVVRRDEHFTKVDATVLAPGDVIRVALGEAVPADVRLIEVNGLECNESILSGESAAWEKSVPPVNADAGLTDSTDLAFMGTIVSAGRRVLVVKGAGADYSPMAGATVLTPSRSETETAGNETS